MLQSGSARVRQCALLRVVVLEGGSSTGSVRVLQCVLVGVVVQQWRDTVWLVLGLQHML